MLRPLASAFASVLACAPLAAAGATVDVAVSAADGGPLADAVVFLEPRDGKPLAARPAAGVEIEQADKQFTQRVTVVPVGTEVAFPNRDKVRHHVYSFSPVKPFELKLYIGTPANPVRFDKPGIAVLGCNIHDTMVAWVVVVETPHHAKTDASGRVRLDGVPAGTWRLRSWHPGLPPGAPAQEQALVVGTGATSVAVRLAGVAR
jgi:plastocyanin